MKDIESIREHVVDGRILHSSKGKRVVDLLYVVQFFVHLRGRCASLESFHGTSMHHSSIECGMS